MPIIRNPAQLQAALNVAAEKALEAVATEVLKKFKEDYVKKYVYDSHSDNKMYHADSGKPTYEFLNVWQFSKMKKTVKTISKELFFNSGKLSHDKDTFLHGSNYPKNDSRANLPDILNRVGYSSSLWVSVYRPTAYWNIFISDMFSGGQLEKIITKHFVANGFEKI